MTVLIRLLAGRFPIEALSYDGSRYLLKNHKEALASSFGYLYDTENEILIIKEEKFGELKFYKGLTNGEVLSIFVGGDYAFLPVKDKTVIDVGGNIGDSAVYFAAMGANKIIAIEPFPQNYDIAKRNIELNHLTDKIELILGGVSSKAGLIALNPDIDVGSGNYTGASISDGVDVSPIPLLTIHDLAQRGNSNEMVLKIDCEGCEYDALLSTGDEILMKFSHVEIEYHHGYRDLKNKLENCGFAVKVKSPLFERRKIRDKWVYIGYIYATNKHRH